MRLCDPPLRGLLFYKYCMQEMAHMLTMTPKNPPSGFSDNKL